MQSIMEEKLKEDVKFARKSNYYVNKYSTNHSLKERFVGSYVSPFSFFQIGMLAEKFWRTQIA